MIGVRNLICCIHKNKSNNFIRCITTASEEKIRQSELFGLEKKRQREAVGRIEKIEVQYEGVPENATLIMNKNLSTPYDCAKHINEMIMNRSVVAVLNDTLWHMHKPIPDSCKLELLHFKIAQPSLVNKAFWRTCSFLLGALASESFKDNVNVQLHSFPSPVVKSGSFVYDIQLSLDNWIPTVEELKVLSIEMIKFCQKQHKIECLDVSVDFAQEMFKYNPHKTKQIPDIAANNSDKVSLFKVGKHVDISKGPMISNTSQIGRFTLANVIKLETDIPGDPIYRFQGVALPNSLILNHFAYGLLEERARKLNSARIPCKQGFASEDHSFVAQIAV
ncbi:mitochondrial ribosome protein l39/prolyl-trna ligase family member [Holotrichia oblita]|uniref:Mitochondrial ribosome protein l39/prolyl-trna ligase family member n=1 Tax=Holotrichia oblita TaxID=644536 RepID=A0ACB9TR61_HOLOL|nr:mitochondrial ribosome protein l39/prolyl-trna ligase family member [Holotrichia oblita]